MGGLRAEGLRMKGSSGHVQTLSIIDTISEMAGGRPEIGERPEPQAEAMDTTADKSEVHGSWSSELVGSAKSVKVKLKKKPLNDIPQVDGHNEETFSDAEVQTKDAKPTTKDAAIQVELKEAFEKLLSK